MRRPVKPGEAVRLGVDAGNLVRDRRGMGRITRGVLQAAFADAAFEVTLLAERRRDALALRAEFPGAQVAAASGAQRSGRYDVVWFPFNGMRFRVAAPTLVSVNDAFAFTEPHRNRVARHREQDPIRRAFRTATRIVTLSEWTREELARELDVDADDITVVSPVPEAFWFPALGDSLPAQLAGKRFVLLVGAVEARKNVRFTLEACAQALHGPGELLVIAGKLSRSDRAFARKKRLNAGEIAAGDTMLRALYRNADAVLVPSLAEGFGLVAVEAMACGAPVLASDASALPATTGGAAWLLDPLDRDAWSAAIRTVLDDPARASALRANGASRFGFADRTAYARRMLALLHELPSGTGA